jgi:hypothetical protein
VPKQHRQEKKEKNTSHTDNVFIMAARAHTLLSARLAFLLLLFGFPFFACAKNLVQLCVCFDCVRVCVLECQDVPFLPQKKYHRLQY